jgi:hypothetical protein
MNKTEYVILDDENRTLQNSSDLRNAREFAEAYARGAPGKEFFIATITHRIKAVIKTEWDE